VLIDPTICPSCSDDPAARGARLVRSFQTIEAAAAVGVIGDVRQAASKAVIRVHDNRPGRVEFLLDPSYGSERIGVDVER
jgi:hypothetical protein